MLVAIGASLSDLAYSDNGEDGEDDDNEGNQQSKLSENDESRWAMGITTKTVEQRIGRFWQKRMKRDKLTQLGWVDAADYFLE
jgi:hypothetical protein